MTTLPVGPTSISGEAADHTIQAFIELVYVKTANDVLVAHMASLENSLGLTKSAMDLLTRVQELHNQVQVLAKGPFSIGSEGSYKTTAENFFKTPVQIGQNVSGGHLSDFVPKLLSVRTQILAMIPQLSAITDPLPGGGEDSNSLLAKLRVVLKDINDSGVLGNISNTTPSAGANNWLIDGYNNEGTGVTDSGRIQQHITNAITAGQSLNTTQTESVRNFLYLFEEYYKSASAVLTAISQIIQKMAGGIAR